MSPSLPARGSSLTLLLALVACAAPTPPPTRCPDPAPVASPATPLVQAQAPATAPTRLILVRHAEKVDASEDAALSDEGRARAEALATVLADEDVTAIYSTDFQRTRDTVAPLAAARGLEVQSYDPAQAATLAPEIVTRHAGHTVVIVGHSPSVPAMINALVGDDRLAKLERFDQLFVVVAHQAGAELVIMRYGPSSPISPGAAPTNAPAKRPTAAAPPASRDGR